VRGRHSRCVKVDIFSDVVCPWCFIGTQRLEHVLAERGVVADVTYRTFLLDPSTPDEGKNVPEMIRRKYGRDPAPMFARVEAEARKSNIPLETAKQPMSYNTVRAHTLLRHAIPLGTQRALVKAMFETYFLEAKNISDPTVLVELAVAHGFTKERAAELLADENELALTKKEHDVPRQLGISGAPFFIFDGKIGVSGAQPEEVFGQVLDEIATAK
jgi:predicted DsbA family dithiol-disulfide isomerase